jgi:hypothetical protein
MKEMISNHDDLDKRLAIFFGLGAFIMSALVGIVRNYTLEGFLLQGVVVMALAILGGYAFGAWLRAALRSVNPEEQLPANVERRSTNPATLTEGTVMVPGVDSESVIADEPLDGVAPAGSVVNFTLPELSPTDLLELPPPGAAPAAPQFTTILPPPTPPRAPEPPAEPAGDLPPPPVPSGVK